ncbi:MAG: preprotein translocase subunit SecG [Pseudonocardiales bacterium]|jgi:preprotein translocase subunit SecG|nr:preprotein translocase subunit SecG [Pseudonocardiales bacterium]
MLLALQIVLIVTSVLLVTFILFQRGKGGGLSSLFGGGVQSSLAGSTMADKNIQRITLFTGMVWLIAIVGVGLLVKVGV